MDYVTKYPKILGVQYSLQRVAFKSRSSHITALRCRTCEFFPFRNVELTGQLNLVRRTQDSLGFHHDENMVPIGISTS
jgi:hypothetical protein